MKMKAKLCISIRIQQLLNSKIIFNLYKKTNYKYKEKLYLLFNILILKMFRYYIVFNKN